MIQIEVQLRIFFSYNARMKCKCGRESQHVVFNSFEYNYCPICKIEIEVTVSSEAIFNGDTRFLIWTESNLIRASKTTSENPTITDFGSQLIFAGRSAAFIVYKSPSGQHILLKSRNYPKHGPISPQEMRELVDFYFNKYKPQCI